MGSKPFSPEEFKQIYSQVTRMCVDVVIATENGVLLLLRKNDGWENMWHFAGSTIFLNESIEDALNRTAAEELGIKIKIKKFLGHMEFHDEKQSRGFGYTISAGFLCEIVEGTPTHDEDSSDLQYFKEIPEGIIPEQGQLLKNNWDEIKIAWE